MIDDGSIRERVTDGSDDKSLRAAIYARTSDTTREHGYSLDAQVSRSLDHCDTLGWEETYVYRDEAISGADTDRPMFQAMIEMAKQGGFDVIVFWKLDRFSRSLMHAVQLEEELREFDVYLYSVTEQIDTTSATGRFNFRNLASAAEFERDMIKQRTQLGMQTLAEDNQWPSKNPPLGYNLTEGDQLSIDETERELVERIFGLYIDAKSMPTVANQLNDDGIETQTGGDWTPRAVGDILRNEIYRGWYEFSDVAEHVPEYQIIDDKVFQEVTDIRHRFQTEGTERTSMPTSRKDAIVEDMKEMYQSYLDSCRPSG
jgi:site-specific DNA recombinase